MPKIPLHLDTADITISLLSPTDVHDVSETSVVECLNLLCGDSLSCQVSAL